MSVAGFDVGDSASCVAVARKRGIDVLLNKESKRETPSLVSFGPKQRYMGTDAVGALTVNPKNTLSQVKRLLGKQFQYPDVQRDIKKLPYKVIEGPDGGCQIEVQYLGETTHFTPEQTMAMLLLDLKAIAEADGSPATDCVIAVPTYFVESERHAMLDAAKIAGLNCIRLMNDNSATALAYGIYKTDLPETEAVNVAFVDMGFSALQVSVVAFKKGQLRVLSHTWDRNCGGRDLDEALFEHFAAEFGEKYKIDIKSNLRGSFRLRLACEKLKKVLSTVAEATINVESLANDVDVHSKITREKFEELAAPVIARVRTPLEQALKEAGLTKDDLASVEVVGGSSRVPAVLGILRDVFGKEPSRTLNAKECVSRGCALQCAMISPLFRVKEFDVVDIFSFNVAFSWQKDGEQTESVLFERGSTIPSTKALTFYRDAVFELKARYTDDSAVPEGWNRTIGTWAIGPPQTPTNGQKLAKLKVKVRLNLHGVVNVEAVQQVDEEEYEEAVKKKPSVKVEEVKDEKMADADAPAEGKDNDMADAAAAPEGTSPVEPATSPAKAGDAAAPAPMETDAAAAEPETEMVRKKRTKKTDIPFRAPPTGLPDSTVSAFFEKEAEMTLQDKVQEETKDAKNAVESYVYSLRNNLAGRLGPYLAEKDHAAVSKHLDDTEEWLYDEGDDLAKSAYVAKLEELRKAGEPIAARAREAETRGPAAQALAATAHGFATQAASKDPKLAHIAPEERQKVTDECTAAMRWLEEKQALQARQAPHEEPALLTHDIRKKEDTLVRVAGPILSRPAPAPPAAKEEAKAEEPATSMETEGAEAPPAAGAEPMEADK